MTNKNEQTKEQECCGLVMPISSIDGCNEQHWSDVKEILTEAVEGAVFWLNIPDTSRRDKLFTNRGVNHESET